MTNLLPPKSQKAIVLRALILRKGIDESMFHEFGFRARLSECRKILSQHGIRIRHSKKEFKTKFGRTGHYFIHFLIDIDKRKAGEVYAALNK